MNTTQVLEDIITELTEHPERWCQGTLARSKAGKSIASDSPEACTWCLEGHFAKRTNTVCNNASRVANDYMGKHQKLYGSPWVTSYNDAQGRTVDDIVTLCKAVLTHLEQSNV